MIHTIRTAPCWICGSKKATRNKTAVEKQTAGCPVCAGSGRLILPPGATLCMACQSKKRQSSDGSDVCRKCGGLGILMF